MEWSKGAAFDLEYSGKVTFYWGKSWVKTERAFRCGQLFRREVTVA